MDSVGRMLAGQARGPVPRTHIKMAGCGGQSREGLNRRSLGTAWRASLAELMVSRPGRNALSVEVTAFLRTTTEVVSSLHTYIPIYIHRNTHTCEHTRTHI